MDTLVNLQAFLATADAAGFSAAARKLKVSTSVVAKRVTQLEDQIGIALFHRSTRQLRLTEAGQQYVHRARGVHSTVIVPMLREDRVIGAIGVSHRDVGAFTKPTPVPFRSNRWPPPPP